MSGHGFGHAIRQIEIVNALLATPSPPRVIVRSRAPRWLFTRAIRGPFLLLPGDTDTGVVQIDSLRLNERATIEAAAAFYQDLPARIATEAALLRDHDERLVIADAPPIACAAARAAEVPAIVCANFTWDWIYQDYADAAPAGTRVVSTVRELYGGATAGWRLPMHGGFETVTPIVELPFVARHSAQSQAEVRRILNLPEGRLALVSFGGYGVSGLLLDRLDCLDGWSVVATAPQAVVRHLPATVVAVVEEEISERGLRYEDLVRAVDVVITKPGYGIISDCLANDAAMLYTSRGRFAEYRVMVEQVPRVLRAGFLAMEDLLGGRWKAALDALEAAPPPPERPRIDGAAVAAEMIRRQLGR